MIKTAIQLLFKPLLAVAFLYVCSLPDSLYFDPPMLFYVAMFLLILATTVYQRVKRSRPR
ncbi:hypothetical protein [Aeromonas schubertii]|uniref:hypothetical protein n=1 Tax=Aeromonas TaxID=642 RepID=UPI00067EED3E|nr:hypothetical protein [Aeromonas schubertii]KUE79700.1 hypothetical protein ATO46_18475 [Aeromonas schubertii]